MRLLTETINSILPINETAATAARRRVDSLLKPIGSLGKLEDLIVRIAGITSETVPTITKRALILAAADNGIVAEGVAASIKEITAIQVRNFAAGKGCINALCAQAGAELVVMDVGVDADLSDLDIRHEKVRWGTANMLSEPAMTRDECVAAMEAGIRAATDCVKAGHGMLGTGEMGIGNTTTSSCVLMAFTGANADAAVGRGAGLTDTALNHKKRIIQQCLDFHAPDSSDPIDVISKVGGLDIAALTGVFLAGARHRVPVLIDGFISTVAALAAKRMNAQASHYMIATHESKEAGAIAALSAVGLTPCLSTGMRLGEGSGCALMFPIVDAALRVMRDVGTLEESAIQNDIHQGN